MSAPFEPSVDIEALPVADRLAALAAELMSLEQQLRPADTASLSTAAEAALGRLLHGTANPQDAAAVGLPVRCARVVVLRCSDERTTALLRASIAKWHRVQVACARPWELTALVARFPRRASPAPQVDDAMRLATAAVRTSSTILAGISSPVDDAIQLASAYREAAAAAALAGELPERLAVADEHWAVLGARRLAQQVTTSLTLDNPLSRLRRYDDEQGTQLLATVGAWLASNCDTASTAADLSVHPNTLRYRLRRAREVSGLDLSDPNARVLTMLVADARAH